MKFLRMEHSHPQKRGHRIGKIKRGKGTKLMVAADGKGIPIGLKLASATPHKSTSIEKTLDTIQIPHAGKRKPRMHFLRLISTNELRIAILFGND